VIEVEDKSSTEQGVAIRSALAGVCIGTVLSSEITVRECRPWERGTERGTLVLKHFDRSEISSYTVLYCILCILDHAKTTTPGYAWSPSPCDG
jgi:hypothetical protein